MTQLLVLDRASSRLAVDADLVERIESAEGLWATDSAAPHLLDLLGLGAGEDEDRSGGRLLTLRGGARVRVPTKMDLVDDVEILAMPVLLRPWTAPVGVTGLVELGEGPTLVCDPRALLADEPGGEGRAAR